MISSRATSFFACCFSVLSAGGGRWSVCASVVAVLACCFLVGCEAEKIKTYTVENLQRPEQKKLLDEANALRAKTQAAVAASQQPRQILGAIVLRGDTAWFFKISDKPELVGPLEQPLTDFLKVVEFSSTGDPTWKLPADWKEQAGNENRYRTLQIPAGPDGKQLVDLAITRLTKSGEDQDYLLTNINRWRGQVGLPDLQLDELASAGKTTPLATDQTALVVSLVGKAAPGGGGMAPFAGGAGGRPRGPFEPPASMPKETEKKPENSPAEVVAGEPKFDLPAEWASAGPQGMRKISLAKVEGDKKAEITLIQLGLGAADVLSNVNRWRGQVKLPPITLDEANAQAVEVPGTGIVWKLYDCIGPAEEVPPQSIVAAMVVKGEAVWFAKMTGDSEICAREKQKFVDFVKTLKVE